MVLIQGFLFIFSFYDDLVVINYNFFLVLLILIPNFRHFILVFIKVILIYYFHLINFQLFFTFISIFLLFILVYDVVLILVSDLTGPLFLAVNTPKPINLLLFCQLTLLQVLKF